MKNKESILFFVLAGIFITNAIVAELVGGKIFSLEGTIGIEQAQILFFGEKWDFNLTAGVIMWPVVFITTDIINEYFGKNGVKRISYFTAMMIIYVFVAIFCITLLAPSQFWMDANSVDDQGNNLNIDYAFNAIFRQGMWIIGGSLVAFLFAQLVDAFAFHRLRRYTGKKTLWLRATGSTLISQLIDSFVVLIIAFYISGALPLTAVISIGIMNYIYKFIIAVAITPVLYLAHYAIDLYLGKNLSNELMEKAAKESKTFL